MRFSAAWSDIASQNVLLKMALVALSLGLVAVSVIATKLSLQEALVVERGCHSKTLAKASAQVTEDEIKAFVAEVLPQRFSSETRPNAAHLSPAQLKQRLSEQEEFAKQGLKQTFIVGSVGVNGESVRVEADRLIAAGKIRSAFPVVLDVSVAQTVRSEANPSGLVLTKASPLEAKEE